MPGANCVFTQCGVARHHVGVGIFKLPTQKADMTLRKQIIQIIGKYCLVDKNLSERLEIGNAYICQMNYKKDESEFTDKL